MNRRTFLKAAAITTMALPTLSYAKKEPKWKKLADGFPTVGQKIILANINGEGFEGGVMAKASFNEKRKDDDFNITIAMTELDFVQCFNSQSKDYMISYVYSDEGEEALRSRTWLATTVRKEHSYHKEIRNNHTYAIYPKDQYVWLPVNGKYPIEIPPLPNHQVANPWINFKDQMPEDEDSIEIKDQTKVIASGRFYIFYGIHTNKQNNYFVLNEKCSKRLNTEIVKINKPFWSWRYVS